MTLGGEKRNELAAEAKGDAYVAALEDVPWWAVQAAARAWYRGECGDFDYRWPPDPATLRKLAVSNTYAIKGHMRELTEILESRPYEDCGDAIERGSMAMRGLFKTIATKGDLNKLDFDTAVNVGRGNAEG